LPNLGDIVLELVAGVIFLVIAVGLAELVDYYQERKRKDKDWRGQ